MSHASLPLAQPTLQRAVSRWQVVAISVNDVIGSGVYLLPAAATALLGPSSLGAVALAGLAVLLIVLCFAEAGSHFDGPGGAYLYTKTAFGELVGFEVGWMTWLARVSSVASLSAGFAQALTFLWPAVAEGVGRTLAIVLPLLLLTVINLVGVRSGAGTAVVLAISKVIPLLVLVAAGSVAFSPEIFAAQAGGEEGTKKWGEAALLLLFAYAGFENVAAPAGEYKNPKRDVPFAQLTQIVVVMVLYCAVQAVVLGVLPNVAASQTPLADAARLVIGPWAGLLLTVGATLSILGTNSNTMLAGPRYLYALAKDGFGPGWIAEIHPRFHTPAKAILLQAAIALPLALSGTFTTLAALSVVARLSTYFGTAAAVPVLRRRHGAVRGGVHLPGGWLIPVLACLVTVVLAASATPRALMTAGVALLVGLGIYALRRRA